MSDRADRLAMKRRSALRSFVLEAREIGMLIAALIRSYEASFKEERIEIIRLVTRLDKKAGGQLQQIEDKRA